MPIRSIASISLAAMLLYCGAGAEPVLAGQVVLSPKGGGFDFEGSLKSFDGQSYVLETAAGTMTLPASNFDCTAGECPTPPVVRASTATPVAGDQPQHIDIKGSQTIGAELLPNLLRAFGIRRGEKAEEVFRNHTNESHLTLYKAPGQPTVEIDLQKYGTASGIQALSKGTTNLATASREMTAEEAAKFPLPPAGQTARYQTTVIGLNSLTFVVSPKRDLQALTLQQIAAIFSGSITDWSQLGLAPGQIKVYVPDVGNGTLDVVVDTVLKPRKLALSPYAIRSNDFAEMSDAVAADPDAITVTPMAFVRDTRPLAFQDVCGIVTPPNQFSIKTEEYPFSRRLNLYTLPQQAPFVADFLRYATSAEAQAAVVDKQFVNQAIIRGALGSETPRITGAAEVPVAAALQRKLAADLSPLRRLSVTYRFASGTSVLDARARDDVNRLATLLAAAGDTAPRIVVAGFTDNFGSLPANIALSQKRAEQVRQALIAATSNRIPADRIVAAGYGPLAPVACNASPHGQDLNRRVEVWVQN